MKATIKLPITSSTKILVEVGDKVDSNAILAQIKRTGQEETIQLAQLLHVNPSLIHRHLKKRVGEEVNSGDLLAEKKSLFSTLRVKSPGKGLIKEIDLKKGTLTLLTGSNEEKAKVALPVSGEIVHIDKDYITVEFEGRILKIHKGDGHEVIGKLIYLTATKVGVFDVDKDVDKCLVLAQAISEETVVKLEVLGTLGLIIQKSIGDTNLPWGQVDDEIFKALTYHVDKKAWLRPMEKQIIIID